MFGYVKPDKMELRLREAKRYSDLYCALCHTIRSDYGQIYGFLLNYDLTFLLIVLNSLCEDQGRMSFRCPFSPLSVKDVRVSERALHYVAFVNYFLVCLKLADDVADDGRLASGVGRWILEHNGKYVARRKDYLATVDKMEGLMHELRALEHSEANFDELTNLFGSFFSEIFSGFKHESISCASKQSIRDLSFDLGKWIYLMDAYDDYLEDVRRERFNLLDTMRFERTPDAEMLHQRVRGIECLLIGGMKRSLEDGVLEKDIGIIKNVITRGCDAQYSRIVMRRYPDFYRDYFANSACERCGQLRGHDEAKPGKFCGREW